MNNNPSGLYEFDSAKRESFRGFLESMLRELFLYRYALYNFVRSNLLARYRRSTLGFFWSLLNPLFSMAILTVVFSTIFKSSLQNFSIYIFSGLLPWLLISNSLMGGSMSLVLGEVYLKKMNVPKLLFPLTTVSVEVVNFFLSLISLFFVAIILGAEVNWTILVLPVALLLTAFFILGMVLIVSVVTVYFRDLAHIIQIVTTGLFYLTPIIYPIELLSSNPGLETMVRWNPLFYFVELFHSIIYQASMPEISLWLICLGLATISIVMGLIVYRTKERDIIYRL